MTISPQQLNEIIGRLERNRKHEPVADAANPYGKPDPNFGIDVREIGKGGIQDEIEQWLKSLGNRCFYVRSRTDKPSTSQVGNADFIGWMRPGGSWHSVICFAIEIKAKNKKPTIAQRARLKQAECAGAITGIAHSLDEFKKLLGL